MALDLNKKIIAWSLYDFADTSFSALFISFFFPILIKRYLGGTEFQIGLALGLSILVTAFLVPFIGALADASGRRIPLLLSSTILTVILTATTGYVGLTAALVLGFFANLTNVIDLDLYNSYIPDLAPPESRGRLSGFGTAIGYLGAIGSLAVGYAILSVLGFETLEGAQVMFPMVAIFYLVFSLPLFFTLRDRRKRRASFPDAAKKALTEIRYTLSHLGEIKGLGPFLLASFLYNDAMHTAIIFLSLFGTERVGLSIQQFFGVFSVMALAAFAGSLLFGKLSDAWGPRKTLVLILFFWMGVILALLAVNTWQTFLIAGSLGGAALGGIWTTTRHMLAILAPVKKVAEIYGYGGLTEKVAGVAGPVGFGYLASRYGYNAGLIFLLFFFVTSLLIVKKYVPSRRV